MKNFYLVYGTLVCLLFAYAAHTGWRVTDSLKSGKWGPRGHGIYHK
jgi:hypothetical protein